MKTVGKLLGVGVLGIPFLVKSEAAMATDSTTAMSFPNTTTTATIPNSTIPAIPCFPFQDPDCCIVHAVCECNNGTFIATNKQYGATSLCNPPGIFVYGDDVGSIPGWCC
ncbi:hypothetical protein GGR51DRAFT_52183 [Nemania sp. FL0031]|nr:hypothetical protein GGR51DRAFT_52183 [Nemania sp. FL0031]